MGLENAKDMGRALMAERRVIQAMEKAGAKLEPAVIANRGARAYASELGKAEEGRSGGTLPPREAALRESMRQLASAGQRGGMSAAIVGDAMLAAHAAAASRETLWKNPAAGSRELVVRSERAQVAQALFERPVPDKLPRSAQRFEEGVRRYALEVAQDGRLTGAARAAVKAQYGADRPDPEFARGVAAAARAVVQRDMGVVRNPELERGAPAVPARSGPAQVVRFQKPAMGFER